MLSNRDYKTLACGTNIYTVCEMDTDYNCRSVQISPANPTNDVYSVAKVFTVTAVGICVDRGLLSTEDCFLDVMGIDLPDGCDAKWRDVTLDMLLRHRFGTTECGLLDIDSDDASSYPSTDYLAMVLSRPLDGVLGVDFCYTDAAFYLLSRAVEHVSGVTVFELLRHPLCEVMRFGEYAWSSCPRGHTMGATGLFIRCADMVKLGVLYLNSGTYRGERILSEEWCRTVLERGYEFSDVGHGWYAKGGMFGQMLAISPNDGLAVGWMGHSGGMKIADVLY